MPSPGHIAVVLGLVSSSYFTFANIGCSYFGVMPATERGKTSLPVVDRLALWEYHYELGKLHMASAGIIATVSLASASYFATIPALRNILAAGAISAFTVPAWTLLFMMPVNNDLVARLRATKLKPMEPKEEAFVLDQLDKWRAMHRLRIALGIVAWLSVATAVLASGPIIQL
ncbi:hypothetical protein DFH07DRAFT_819781 [Mycena maculata]|uniref:DUF1772-domain-containing protein n=1 Tax=Mycena maculata TaxID=230809 RepID=A0AAD7J5M1_9AGAR|nr:hypothetical protein DFH07DRAFT_819781 [Mycena maculata]